MGKKRQVLLSLMISLSMIAQIPAVFAEMADNNFKSLQSEEFKEQNENPEEKENTDKSNTKTSSEVIGKTETKLEGSYTVIGKEESNYANLINDAMLNKTGAELSMINTGTIINSIDKGDITVSKVSASLMFGTNVITKDLTGKQIKEILEAGASIYPDSSSTFVHPGGFSYKIDASKKSGEKITSITIDGEKIDSSKKYRVAVNDYMESDYSQLYYTETIESYGSIDGIVIEFIKTKVNLDYKNDGRINIKEADVKEDDKVKNLISAIDALTYENTDDNINKVKEAVKVYNALSEDDKKKVTNVSRLEDIVEKLQNSGAEIDSAETPAVEKSISGESEAPSPETGDTSMIVPVVVFLVAAGGLYLLKKNKI